MPYVTENTSVDYVHMQVKEKMEDYHPEIYFFKIGCTLKKLDALIILRKALWSDDSK